MKNVINVGKRILFGMAGVILLGVLLVVIYGVTIVFDKIFGIGQLAFNWISQAMEWIFQQLVTQKLDPFTFVVTILGTIVFLMLSSFVMWFWKRLKEGGIKIRKKQKNKKERKQKRKHPKEDTSTEEDKMEFIF